MRRIGLVPNAEFGDLDASVRSVLEGVPKAAQQAMQEAIPRMANVVNGWQIIIDTIGVYGNFYMKRAIVSMLGLGSNCAEDAVYPILLADADGDAVTGDNDYTLHFEADELPPVRSFWSVTVYDQNGFTVGNEINRFRLAGYDPLQFNGDGSLDIYVQHENPGPDKHANWLPTPREPFGLLLRLYLPTAQCPPWNVGTATPSQTLTDRHDDHTTRTHNWKEPFMERFDVTKTNSAVERELEKAQSPRHRYLLTTYLRHRCLEMAGRHAEVFAPEMTVENPVYRFNLIGQSFKLEGKEALEGLYNTGHRLIRASFTPRTRR